MKKFLILLLLLATALSLASCDTGLSGNESDIPSGMKIAESGAGYTFYVPEDWTVETSTGLTMVYVSTTDHSNVTLVRIATDKTPAAYFAENEATLSSVLDGYALLEARDDTTFGGVTASVRVYTGKVAGVEYKYMQFLTQKDGTLYLFTYTAETRIPSGDVSYYDRYVETVLEMADAFAFRGEATEPGTATPPEEIRNEAGLLLVSDPAVARYSLYAPDSWQSDLRNGTTSISKGGAVVTVTVEYPQNAQNIAEYWAAQVATYEKMYEDFTIVEAECSAPVEKVEDIEVWLDGYQAVRYVYTFTHAGTAYKVQRLMTRDGIYFVSLTYTAKADVYDSLKADFDTMIGAFTFD